MLRGLSVRLIVLCLTIIVVSCTWETVETVPAPEHNTATQATINSVEAEPAPYVSSDEKNQEMAENAIYFVKGPKGVVCAVTIIGRYPPNIAETSCVATGMLGE